MIREERNALLLLLAFTLAAGLLYLFILRPALTEATRPTAAKPSSEPAAEQAVDTRPRAARRMVSLSALLLDSVTGDPLAAADVAVLDVDDIVDPAVVIDADGVLRIDFLPPAISFGLTIECANHLPRAFSRLRAEAKETIDLGLVTLEPVRRLSGEVLDPDGSPLADCVVTAFPVDLATGSWTDLLERSTALAQAMMSRAAGTVRSNDDGKFALDGLEPGRYAVYAVQKPYAGVLVPNVDLGWRNRRQSITVNRGPPARGRVDVAGKGPLADGTVVLIEAGSALSNQLSAAYCRTDESGFFGHHAVRSVPHFVFVKGGAAAAAGSGPYLFDPREEQAVTAAAGLSAAGAVKDTDRLPVKTAAVRVTSDQPLALPVVGNSDEKGNWQVTGLLSGPARVVVTARGHAPDRGLIDVGSTAVDHRVHLLAAGVLVGTVLCEGQPVVGAVVAARRPGCRAITDRAGFCRLEGLPAGQVTVTASARGLYSEARRVEIHMQDENSADFVLEPGGEVRVLVTGPADIAVQGAVVQAVMIDDTETAEPSPFRSAVTDSSGFARLVQLPRDRRVVLFATGAAGSPARSLPLEATPERGRVGVALSLPTPARITGAVTDEVGAPLAQVWVRLAAAPETAPLDRLLLELSHADTQTDSSGEFSLGGLPSGSYRIVATLSGRRSAMSDPVSAAEGAVIDDVQLTLLPHGSASGVVLDENGRPVPGAVVRLQPTTADGSELFGDGRLWVTDGAGRFLFPRPPGQFLITAESRDRGHAETPLEAVPGPYELRLTRP